MRAVDDQDLAHHVGLSKTFLAPFNGVADSQPFVHGRDHNGQFRIGNVDNGRQKNALRIMRERTENSLGNGAHVLLGVAIFDGNR